MRVGFCQMIHIAFNSIKCPKERNFNKHTVYYMNQISACTITVFVYFGHQCQYLTKKPLRPRRTNWDALYTQQLIQQSKTMVTLNLT